MPQIAQLRGTLPDDKGARVRDPGRALYRYHQVFQQGGRTVTRKSLICAVRLEPWAERVIRAHELADPQEVLAARAQLEKTHVQDQAIFAGYRDAAGEVDRVFRGVDSVRPTLEHTTPDGTIHRVFRAPSAELFGPLLKVFAPKKVHVLDGHARYEALLAYSAALDAKRPLAMYSTANYGLMCLCNLDDITVYETTVARHRVVRGKVDPAAAIAAAKGKFIVDVLAGAGRDAAKQIAALGDSVAHQPAFVISFKGHADAYKLTLSPDVSPARQGVPVNRALQKMTPVVVDLVYRPLALADTTFTTQTDAAKALAADADAVIVMPRVTLAELIHADELGELLPAHSTAFAPAIDPRIGFAIDPDEDVK